MAAHQRLADDGEDGGGQTRSRTLTLSFDTIRDLDRILLFTSVYFIHY